jgi:hypothetical protein
MVPKKDPYQRYASSLVTAEYSSVCFIPRDGTKMFAVRKKAIVVRSLAHTIAARKP